MQKYENFSFKSKIKSIIQNKTHKEFEIQQQELYELLENWIDSYCLFFKYDNKVLKDLYDITICDESGEETEYCKMIEGENKLLIPDINLYTNEDNKIRYVSILTNELLLNRTIQNKLLQNAYGYFYDDFIYRVKKDEIILLEKILKKYFDSLHERNKSKYC